MKDNTKKDGSLEAFADERVAAVHSENETIARRARALATELKAAKRETETARAQTVAAERALSLYHRKYDDRPTWTTKAKKAADRGALVAVLSDTHYGEVVNLAEMNGYNKYNLAIAEQRTEMFFRNVVQIARTHFSGIQYDGVYLALGGDLVSGDIHPELEQSNAASTYDTIVWAVPRLTAGIEMLAKEFGKVHVVSAPGNHGRDDKIPRYKGRTAHNADQHIAKLLAMTLDKSGDITFNVTEALDATFDVYGWTFGLEHGDELSKNFSGSAEIGWLGPLIRGTNRKVNAYAAEGKKLDVCIWGHGHQLVPIPARGAIGNGSLCGYNEFARGRKFRPEPPQQAVFVVDPRYGITLNAPVRVQDRSVEGW